MRWARHLRRREEILYFFSPLLTHSRAKRCSSLVWRFGCEVMSCGNAILTEFGGVVGRVRSQLDSGPGLMNHRGTGRGRPGWVCQRRAGEGGGWKENGQPPDQCRLRLAESTRRKGECVCVLVCRGCLESSLRILAIIQDGQSSGDGRSKRELSSTM